MTLNVQSDLLTQIFRLDGKVALVTDGGLRGVDPSSGSSCL